MLYQIRAPHYTSGIIVNKTTGFVTAAAPIIKWAVGKEWTTVAAYFIAKKYEIIKVE